MIEKLLKLGFKKEAYLGGEEAYVFRLSSSASTTLRHDHDFVYYEDENTFYINCYYVRGLTTISEAEVLRNHNDLNSDAKYKWLEIKKELQEFVYEVAK